MVRVTARNRAAAAKIRVTIFKIKLARFGSWRFAKML